MSIDIDADPRSSGMRRQPALWVLVVEWPRWDDGEESEGSACEANIEGELDILCHETGKESSDLED